MLWRAATLPGRSLKACVSVAICGLGGLLTLGRKCRTWAREAGSTLAGCGGKAARRPDWLVGMSVLLHPYARLPGVEYAKASQATSHQATP